MSKTVNISSPSQFTEVLQGSRLVLANCMYLPRRVYPAMRHERLSFRLPERI
jgi:hypothetical protein